MFPKKYVVLLCPNCGLPQYTLIGQKTRKCPGCGSTFRPHSEAVIKVFRTNDLSEAVAAVKYFKGKGKNLKNNNFKTADEV